MPRTPACRRETDEGYHLFKGCNAARNDAAPRTATVVLHPTSAAELVMSLMIPAPSSAFAGGAG